MTTEQPNKYWQERNDALLDEMKDTFGCSDVNIRKQAFYDTPFSWKCPGCSRGKKEIARVDSNGKLACIIVGHHDHFGDRVAEVLHGSDWQVGSFVAARFIRFPTTLMCEDCNNIDAAAKVRAQARKCFSFAPFEISLFINESPNRPHSLKPGVAGVVYETARVQMQWICDRIKDQYGPEVIKEILKDTQA